MVMFVPRGRAFVTLDSLVTFRRFYNPPSRKSWSKQHAAFRTPRPLVEPYNLGRLHPEKEWWKLPKRGLTPETFMGFPDVANISQRGGSLYTHLMDGPTLSMIVYRCLDKDIDDVVIWKKLTLQALKLAMSLDPYIISILFLYFSKSNHYDYKFVATFSGRILATLDQFTLDECANIFMAMNNPKYCHTKILEYVIRHAEVICLSNLDGVTTEQSLRLLASLSNLRTIPRNILISIGEFLEVSDLGTVEENLILDSLESCCKLGNSIDILCTSKLFWEVCQRFELVKSPSHNLNLAILNAIATFDFRRPILLRAIFSGLKESIATATLYEQCRYLELSSELDEQMPVGFIKNEVLKSFDKLLEQPSLAIQALKGFTQSPEPLGPAELKLFVEVLEKIDSFSVEDTISIYGAIANAKCPIGDEFAFLKNGIASAAWKLLPKLTLSQICTLMRCGHISLESSVEQSYMEDAFKKVIENIVSVDSKGRIALLSFANRDVEFAKKILHTLENNPKTLPNSGEAVSWLFKLYARAGIPIETSLMGDAFDNLCKKDAKIDDEQRRVLLQLMRDHKIKHYTLERKLGPPEVNDHI